MDNSSKAKRDERKARRQAIEAQEAAKRLAKKEEKRRREAEFKQTIVGNYIVDDNGNPIRRYSLAERILDNKVIGYGIGIGVIVLSLLALLVIHGF